MRRLSVREVRQALIGKGNLRNLLSDRILTWDPYSPKTFDFFKSIYDQESIDGWKRISTLYRGLTPIEALENTWSVLSHFPELTNFLLRGIELDGDSKSLARAKSLKKLTLEQTSTDPFEFLNLKPSSDYIPDLLGVNGFEPEIQIRWGMASRAKLKCEYQELIIDSAKVAGIDAGKVTELIKEAIETYKADKSQKITQQIATRFTKKEFEIFVEDESLFNRIYSDSSANTNQLISQLLALNDKYHTDCLLIQSAISSLVKRDWESAGKIAEQIAIDNTSKIAASDLIANAESINELINTRSFNSWKPMTDVGYQNLNKLLPNNTCKTYWALSSNSIAEALIQNELDEKSLNEVDVIQLFSSWSEIQLQQLISAEKFCSIPLHASIWKNQSLETLTKAAIARINDGSKLLIEHLLGVPDPKELIECITKLKSERATQHLKEIIDWKLRSNYYSRSETKYACNWAEHISSEIGTKHWALAVKNNLLGKTTFPQVLFASEFGYSNTKLKSFQAEVVKLLQRTNDFESDISKRLVKWFERDISCLEFIAPCITANHVDSFTKLSSNECSFESILALYKNVAPELKEKIWRYLLELVLTAKDLSKLLIDGAKNNYVFNWNHKWKQVSGNVEARARALVLATRFDPVRLNKIKADFTKEAMTSALLWAAKQLPSNKTHEIAYLELSALLGTRHSETIHWLLRERKFEEPSGSKLRHLYAQHQIPKKSGKLRTISVPSSGLKRIQKALLLQLLNPLGAHDSAYGFVTGRSIVGNASLHTEQKIVVNADVSNCFPSVKWQLVLASLRRDLSQQLGAASISAISDICTNEGGLPIGAPTSPALLNRVLMKTDEILTVQAQLRGCQYSRYADDLTFSGDEKAIQLLGISKSVLRKIDLELDPLKTNIFRRGRRQMCTGLVVNESVNLPRAIRKRIRASVHAYENGRDVHWNGKPVSTSALTGRLNYLKMVSPQHAAGLAARFDAATHKPKSKPQKLSSKKVK